jgi:hypothetical protein
MRSKSNKIDHYFTFLEQRYAGEILRRFGVAVELRSTSSTGRSTAATSGCGCRPRSGRRGSSSRDGGNRWRPPRKPVVARRDYVMGKLAFISGVRRPSSAGCSGDPPQRRTGRTGRRVGPAQPRRSVRGCTPGPGGSVTRHPSGRPGSSARHAGPPHRRSHRICWIRTSRNCSP